jgi:hypothetical protein
VKHALRAKGGENAGVDLNLADLAIATAQREITVHKGLVWLAAKGYIIVLEEGERAVRLRSKEQTVDSSQVLGMTSETEASTIAGELKALLDETAAYRRYFTHVEKDRLLP